MIGKRVLAAVLLMAICEACEGAENWDAPNGQLTCFSRLGRRSKGEELWIRLRGTPAPQLLWASDAQLEAEWSADSRFIAVTDHYDRKHHAVLIFGVAYNIEKQTVTTGLLFQTPLPEERNVSWKFLGWDLKKAKVILGRTEGRRKTIVDGFLSDEPVEQDLYSVDPRGWIVETKPEKVKKDESRRAD